MCAAFWARVWRIKMKTKFRYTIQIAAVIALILTTVMIWQSSVWAKAFAIIPYLIIFLVASSRGYSTTSKLLLRSGAAILVLVIAGFIALTPQTDAQSGIGIMLAICVQYALIFAAEAIIYLSLKPSR